MIGKFLDGIKLWHIVAACVAVYICALTKNLSLSGDDSTYILFSRMFVTKGFFNVAFISNELAKSSYYYFFLPLLLMPFAAFAPSNYLAMKSIPIVSAVGVVIMLDIFLRDIVGDRTRKVILILFAFNPWVVEYSGLILTEMPYMLLMLTCLVLFNRYEDQRKEGLLVMSVLAAGLCFYTRPFGAALYISLFAYTAFRRRWRDLAIISAVAVIVAIPILLHAGDLFSTFFNNFVAKQDYYAYDYNKATLFHLVYRSGYNLLVYAGNYLPDLLARPALSGIYPRLVDGSINPAFFFKFSIGACLSWLILAGFLRTAKYHIQPYHIYSAFHIIMALTISVYVARYLLPLLPFVLLFIAIALAPDGKIRGFPGFALVSLAVILFALAAAGSAEEIAYSRAGRLSAEEKSFVECNDWVKANTPEGAVILSRKPSYTKVYTGRGAVWYIYGGDPAAQVKYIHDKQADFVIIGDLGFYLHEAEYLIDTVHRYPELFHLRYTTRNRPENYVYEVARQGR